MIVRDALTAAVLTSSRYSVLHELVPPTSVVSAAWLVCRAVDLCAEAFIVVHEMHSDFAMFTSRSL